MTLAPDNVLVRTDLQVVLEWVSHRPPGPGKTDVTEVRTRWGVGESDLDPGRPNRGRALTGPDPTPTGDRGQKRLGRPVGNVDIPQLIVSAARLPTIGFPFFTPSLFSTSLECPGSVDPRDQGLRERLCHGLPSGTGDGGEGGGGHSHVQGEGCVGGFVGTESRKVSDV